MTKTEDVRPKDPKEGTEWDEGYHHAYDHYIPSRKYRDYSPAFILGYLACKALIEEIDEARRTYGSNGEESSRRKS